MIIRGLYEGRAALRCMHAYACEVHAACRGMLAMAVSREAMNISTNMCMCIYTHVLQVLTYLASGGATVAHQLPGELFAEAYPSPKPYS